MLSMKKTETKSKNMLWKFLEDDTSCQAAERNPEKALVI